MASAVTLLAASALAESTPESCAPLVGANSHIASAVSGLVLAVPSAAAARALVELVPPPSPALLDLPAGLAAEELDSCAALVTSDCAAASAAPIVSAISAASAMSSAWAISIALAVSSASAASAVSVAGTGAFGAGSDTRFGGFTGLPVIGSDTVGGGAALLATAAREFALVAPSFADAADAGADDGGCAGGVAVAVSVVVWDRQSL